MIKGGGWGDRVVCAVCKVCMISQQHSEHLRKLESMLITKQIEILSSRKIIYICTLSQ